MAVFQHLNLNKLSSVEQEIYRFIVNNLEKVPYMRVRILQMMPMFLPLLSFVLFKKWDSIPSLNFAFISRPI